MLTPVYIGVDNGGTWIRMVGLNAKGNPIWTFKKPSPPVDKLPQFLKRHLHQYKGRLDGLAVGSRAVWKTSKRRAIKQALRGLAKNIVVMSDVEAAWMAAFGLPHPAYGHLLPRGRRQTAVGPLHQGEGARRAGEGIIVISGTGSIAYGRKANGTIARTGGLGPEKGDEGSGYWIGKEWLKRTGRAKDLKKSVRDIASLSPKVLTLAKRKNPIALGITCEAQYELAKLVIDLAQNLRLKTVPISCSGSIFKDSWFRNGFFRALARLHVKHRSLKTDAAMALARSIIGHGAG
jgi:N-acetylglucosamine kinase-like BadF-type ATPase